MKNRILPTRILLTDLPPEGREFHFDQETGEMTPVLADLIGTHPYEIDLKVKPMGNVYQLEGQLKTSMDLLCSRCGIDFTHPIKARVNEILVIEESPLGKGDSTSRVNHTSDLGKQDQDFTLLPTPHFDIGEFVHEIIALAEPIQPLGKVNCDEACENLEEAYRKGWLRRPEDTSTEKEFEKSSPFAGLKGIKLNS